MSQLVLESENELNLKPIQELAEKLDIRCKFILQTTKPLVFHNSKNSRLLSERNRINYLSSFLLGANMQTFRQHFKQSLTLFLFIVSFLSFSNVFAETTETGKQINIGSGVYQGFTPCDDCKGVKTSLALNQQNNTYILITQYVGKSEREIVEKGKFTLNNENKTIELTPRNNSQTRHYFIGENTLTQLDNDGNRFKGELADRYILRRSEIKGTQTQSSHH
jgi:hypothetical protein